MSFFKFLWENPIYIFWLYIGIMTIVSFTVMGVDKHFARKNKQRISEASLFLLAIIGGSIGSIAGMYTFRHKTLHKSFKFGLPLILILQAA
ncbi:MAG: DUF1294 domain-containing protein, partial [Oscillospiraceae bacterium]